LHAGDLRAALIRAEEARDLAEKSGMPDAAALSRLVLAEVLCALGRTTEAREQVVGCRAYAESTRADLLGSDCDLVEVRILIEAGDPEALRALAEAMATIRRRGFLSVGIMSPGALARVCLESLDAGIEVAHVQKLARVRHLRPDPPPYHCAAWPWDVRVVSLGRFEIKRDERTLEFKGRAPVRILALVKALAAVGADGASESRLAEMLWPDADGDMAHQALATSLHRLRRMLGHDKAVHSREGRVRLDTRYCWVDAYAFEELFDSAEARMAAAERRTFFGGPTPVDGSWRLIERALDLYKGSFLDGASEPWVVSCRERLRGKFLRAVSRIGAHYENERRHDEAVRRYLKGIEADPTAESLYLRAMKCLATAGRAAEALALYKRCRRVLRSTMAVDPSSEIEAFHSVLLRQNDGASVAPAIR
jgi:DNA-binding SARP family transcriptional activator